MLNRLLSAIGYSSVHGFARVQGDSDVPAPPTTSVKPYVDKAGMPHGKPGNKLVRKAMVGTVTLRHTRGPYAAWASASVAKGWRHGRRPGYSKTRSL